MSRNAIQTLVQDYGWIHTGIGLLVNLTFFVGSILFLPRFEAHQTQGVWLFIAGSFLMLLGAAGDMVMKWLDRERGAS